MVLIDALGLSRALVLVAAGRLRYLIVTRDGLALKLSPDRLKRVPMRILLLSQFYPPIIGGEEIHVRGLGQELVARGHDVAVATLRNDGLDATEMDGGVRVHRIQSTAQRFNSLFTERDRRHAAPFPDPEAVLALQRLVAREQPDIVHAHNWLLHSFLPVKFSSGVKLVVTLHDYSFRCAQKRLMYRNTRCDGPELLKCLSCASAHYGALKGVPTVLGNWASGAAERAAVDMFVAVSQAVAEGNGLPRSRLPFQVIPNFMTDDHGAPGEQLDSYLDQLPQGDFLLFVGDLGRDKGLDVLLSAYEGLQDAPPLVLIGRASKALPEKFPANVIFLKSWPHQAVMQAWERSTLALVPSVWPEPFGYVAIEAMASGRAVIASDIGGLRDIVVDGETGRLVPPGDARALRQAIDELLRRPELRRTMGEAGRRRVVQFQASTIIPQIERLYQKLLAEESEFEPGVKSALKS